VTQTVALALVANAMITAAKIAAPIVLSAMVVGLLVSIFQSVTQIQEMTLTFVPKLLAVGLVFVTAGHWMLSTYIGYVDNLFQSIPQLLAGG
jgi:flagellar biosynthesis protein FliQ